MSEELQAQTVVAEGEDRVKGKSDLMLWQAITMSLVAILAVAVGTIYGTILF
ncbi:MAG: hypothetical protein NTW79_01525 [Candidatus Berkelbacteria bacterium]|nr:hypothetical protein [Candidatus Berkelbacteria bacterium]